MRSCLPRTHWSSVAFNKGCECRQHFCAQRNSMGRVPRNYSYRSRLLNSHTMAQHGSTIRATLYAEPLSKPNYRIGITINCNPCRIPTIAHQKSLSGRRKKRRTREIYFRSIPTFEAIFDAHDNRFLLHARNKCECIVADGSQLCRRRADWHKQFVVNPTLTNPENEIVRKINYTNVRAYQYGIDALSGGYNVQAQMSINHE